jgi:hypothetical protein
MKSFIALAAFSFALLVSVQSCLTCTKCKRDDLEVKCVKPNDTLIFSQYTAHELQFHRFYNGGDTIFHTGASGIAGFESTVQHYRDSGYICDVYATGHVSEMKKCNEGGEKDDMEYAFFGSNAEDEGYTCHEYKGH